MIDLVILVQGLVVGTSSVGRRPEAIGLKRERETGAAGEEPVEEDENHACQIG